MIYIYIWLVCVCVCVCVCVRVCACVCLLARERERRERERERERYTSMTTPSGVTSTLETTCGRSHTLKIWSSGTRRLNNFSLVFSSLALFGSGMSTYWSVGSCM